MTRACAPNASTCADTQNRRVCDANGLGSTLAPCAAGQRCDAGTCRTIVCSASTARCLNPQTVETCASDGLSASTTPCPADRAARAAPAPVGLHARERELQPSARRVCNGDRLREHQRRLSHGRGVQLRRVPTAGVHAQRGPLLLNPQTLERCAPDGFSASTTTCPSSTSCASAACAPWVCTPNAVSCASTPGTRSVCSSDGLSSTSAPCPVPTNASAATCASGSCGFTCASGYGDCDLDASNGCEVTVTTDARHCGGCGRACAAIPNAETRCESGGCAMGACLPGFANCDNNASNGCEVNLASDRLNCGGCGMVCPVVCRDRACTNSIHNTEPFTATATPAQGCQFNNTHQYRYVNLGT